MISRVLPDHSLHRTLILLAVTAVMLIIAGCTGVPSSPPVSAVPTTTPLPVTTAEKVPPITVERVGSEKLIVHFQGGEGLDNLMEIEITVTDSRGTSKTQSLGTRQATTPVQRYATSTFVGSFAGRTRVLAVGYSPGGSLTTLLDTAI
jgi:hypothetical protein